MTDVAPKQKTTPRDRIAHFISVVFDDTATLGERRNAYGKAKLAMEGASLKGSDLGNWMREGADGKYTEAEMQEYAALARTEGIEVGMKIEEARAKNSNGNGGGTYPPPPIMADYCHARLGCLTNNWQRKFIINMFRLSTRPPMNLSRLQLSKLVQLYIELGGKV